VWAVAGSILNLERLDRQPRCSAARRTRRVHGTARRVRRGAARRLDRLDRQPRCGGGWSDSIVNPGAVARWSETSIVNPGAVRLDRLDPRAHERRATR
jgi:hypothetical protein